MDLSGRVNNKGDSEDVFFNISRFKDAGFDIPRDGQRFEVEINPNGGGKGPSAASCPASARLGCSKQKLRITTEY